MAAENAETTEYQDNEKQAPFPLAREREPMTCRRCGAYCACTDEELDAGGPA